MRALVPIALLATLAGCNKPPEGLTISLEPEAPHTLDDLTVLIVTDAVDPNGKDTVSYRYVWSVDDSRIDELSEGTVTSGRTNKNQTWSVSVSPWDGVASGTAATASVTIVNSLPTAEVTHDPEVPVTTDDVELLVTPSDLDNDAVTSRFVWKLNGSVTSLTTDTLRANRTRKGEVWEVEVYPSDDEAEGLPATTTFTIGNTPPEVVSALIVSDIEPPTAEASLTCDGRGWTDVDEDVEGYRVQWFINGVAGPADGTLAGAFVRGDNVACQLTPFDGDDEGEAVMSKSVVIRNAPPSLDSVTIGPEDPVREDTVVATFGTSVDADGDEISYLYSWRVAGREVASSTDLPSSRFKRDDAIVLWVTPTDGRSDGEAVRSNEVIGGNNVPVITKLSLAPDPLYTDDTVTAGIEYEDFDGDDVDLSVQWYKNTALISPTTATLDGKAWFERGDELYAVVRPDDGADLGDAVTSAKIVVQNSLPTLAVLSLDPAEPVEGEAIQCMIDTLSTDLDLDTLTYTFAWTVEGSPVAGTTTTYANDTLGSKSWSDGDEVVCTVTPHDGYADGPTAEVSLSQCGNGVLDSEEEVDPAPGPYTNVKVDTRTCRWDFSKVKQLYCSGSCSWAGSTGCDKADADLFCKLKMDNPKSASTSFKTGTASADPGFPCAPLGYGTKVNTDRGVTVSRSGYVTWQDTSIVANHGGGTVINSIVCTDP